MKKTPLKRKTALKSNSKLKRKTCLKSTTGFKPKLDDKGFPVSSFAKSQASAPQQHSALSGARVRSPQNSMKGKGRTSSDKEFHEALVSLGCLACCLESYQSRHHLEVHHVDGRNKGREGDCSEALAICLCVEHHDQRRYNGFFNADRFVPVREHVPSIHHDKNNFVARFGTEIYLVHLSYERLSITPPWLSVEEWRKYLLIGVKEGKELWLSEYLRNQKRLKTLDGCTPKYLATP